MNTLRALTPEEMARAEARLRNPSPGSRIEAAKKYGIELGNLIEKLRLTPTERARQGEEVSYAVDTIRGAARHLIPANDK